MEDSLRGSKISHFLYANSFASLRELWERDLAVGGALAPPHEHKDLGLRGWVDAHFFAQFGDPI